MSISSRDVGADPLSPLMVGGFADILSRVLASKILEFKSQGEREMLPVAKAAASVRRGATATQSLRQANR